MGGFADDPDRRRTKPMYACMRSRVCLYACVCVLVFVMCKCQHCGSKPLSDINVAVKTAIRLHITSHEHTYDCTNLFCVRRDTFRTIAARSSKRKRDAIGLTQRFPEHKPRAVHPKGLPDSMVDRDVVQRWHFRKCLTARCLHAYSIQYMECVHKGAVKNAPWHSFL